MLWNRFRNGDREAFGQLAGEYYRALYNYGLRLSADKSFVSDCIQELFLELWERRSFLSGTNFVKTYLLRALRHKIIKESIRLRRFQEPGELDFLTANAPSIESDIVQGEQERLQFRQLNEILDQLTKRQQEIIYLRFYQDLEYDEISDIMSLTRQSVANLLHRTLKDIRSKWVVLVICCAFFFSCFFKPLNISEFSRVL